MTDKRDSKRTPEKAERSGPNEARQKKAESQGTVGDLHPRARADEVKGGNRVGRIDFKV